MYTVQTNYKSNMEKDELRSQINDIIEADIQLGINDYLEQEGKGFKGQELNVKVSQSEVDKIIKEYNKIKKQQKSNISQIKKLDLLDKNGNPL